MRAGQNQNLASNTSAGHPVRTLLDSCRSARHLKETHAHFMKEDPAPFGSSASSLLLSSYAVSPHGDMAYASRLFTCLRSPSIFSWNCMIRGLSAGRKPEEAVSFYSEMLRRGFRPNKYTFPFVIKACTGSSLIRCGVSVHTHAVKSGLESDPYIQSTLIHMYADGKDLGGARKLFDQCSERDVVSWNSMIDGYVKCGELDIARAVFDRMVCRDVISWNTMINGYALLGDLAGARDLFERMPHRNMVSWNSMLAGHAKCGDVEGTYRIFSEMPQRDVVSWNAMLACYAQSGQSNEALALFNEMRRAYITPTDATIVSLLSACAHLGALDQGEHVHAYMRDHMIEINTVLGTALVDMYAKCGSIHRAKEIFRALEHRDVLAWNTIIAGLAIHGHAREALQLFDEMTENEMRPDDITFVAVLSACSHSGMVDKGRQLLDLMSTMYGIDPKVEHYGCLIDLLARSGQFEEAMDVIGNMPMEPNANAWGALLGGCRIHGNVNVGEGVGKHLLNLQPKHSGRYVLLSNIYATASRWDEARRVRNLMDDKGVAKLPGLSMIELEGVVHQFTVADRTHLMTDDIYQKLSEILKRLKTEVGYSPDTKQVMFNVEEEEKEHALSVHSEKLAVAFGLLCMKDCTTAIRVVKNLRVCGDCHQFMKLISRVYGREIIMRDRNRFHQFSGGECSCRDHW
uniref:Pentatricopeptide repeat-containing protein At2g29760, chloroplastic n=1 Tax=Anthurium amnicola TaxID=1678845 RepID=A0A1D1XLS4_9ARAE